MSKLYQQCYWDYKPTNQRSHHWGTTLQSSLPSGLFGCGQSAAHLELQTDGAEAEAEVRPMNAPPPGPVKNERFNG